MALVANGIGRSFRQVEVLRGVDLAVAPGEFVTIGGPSGSGKSALLSILCGFDRPDVGTVLIRDVELDGAPSWQRCAVLPQALGLAGELTLAENTALPLLLTGSPEAKSRSVAVLTELGIGDLADRYPNEVSYGQQQRAALARAIVVEPEVLLVDEPTAHVDHASAEVVLTVLRRVADRGTAVLAATHDPRVHAVADRRLRLDKGRLVA